MHGGRTLTSSAAALALLAGLGGLSGFANAADLGGNCCADLEERIAELEATTARKGNRKVSLEIYGQVNETLLFWDDGFESNAGVYTNDNSRTRIGFRGKAKINGDWSAGYRLEIGVRAANSKRFNQDDPQIRTIHKLPPTVVSIFVTAIGTSPASRSVRSRSAGRRRRRMRSPRSISARRLRRRSTRTSKTPAVACFFAGPMARFQTCNGAV